MTQKVNTGEGEIQGIEFAYQQTYDFLPGIWSGLGAQFNYTYVDSSGVPNSDLARSGAQQPNEPVVLGANGDLDLEGQSEHNVNLVAFYENDKISLRAAYNWRSDYLVTTRDVISRLPVFNEAVGFLDASVFYNLNDTVKVGIQGTNLLDTVTQTTTQLDTKGTKQDRAWFINDRRYAFVVRAKF